MCVIDLMEQFEIQGMYHIKRWDDEEKTYITLVKGECFEFDGKEIKEKCSNTRITYMYAVDGILNIEVE